MIPTIIWRRDANRTYQIGAHNVTPVAQSVGMRWRSGGWLWQFPLAVEIKDEESGAQTRLPIPDPTRALVWFLYALALIIVVNSTLTVWRKRQRAKQESTRQERIKG